MKKKKTVWLKRSLLTFILILWFFTILYRIDSLGPSTNDLYFWFMVVAYDVLWLSSITYVSKKAHLSQLFLNFHYCILNIGLFICLLYIPWNYPSIWGIMIPIMLLTLWVVDRIGRYVVNSILK